MHRGLLQLSKLVCERCKRQTDSHSKQTAAANNEHGFLRVLMRITRQQKSGAAISASAAFLFVITRSRGWREQLNYIFILRSPHATILPMLAADS